MLVKAGISDALSRAQHAVTEYSCEPTPEHASGLWKNLANIMTLVEEAASVAQTHTDTHENADPQCGSLIDVLATQTGRQAFVERPADTDSPDICNDGVSSNSDFDTPGPSPPSRCSSEAAHILQTTAEQQLLSSFADLDLQLEPKDRPQRTPQRKGRSSNQTLNAWLLPLEDSRHGCCS